MKGSAGLEDYMALDERLSAASELMGKRRKLEGMLERLDGEKSGVPPHVYEKVKNEYTRSLSEVTAELSPILEEARRARSRIDAQLSELEPEISGHEDTLAELKLRYRVGEFDEPTYRTRSVKIEKELSEKMSLKEELSAMRERLDSISDGKGTLREHERPKSNEAREELFEPWSDEPSTAQEPAKDDYENPSEWLSDLDDDPERSSFGKRLVEEKSVSLDSAATRGTPILLVKTPTGKERRVPILPVTMTIGREHDNNIELKDAAVSRYHARIVHSSGRYILETLEGASSTTVNGKPATRIELKEGDLIKMGKSELLFTLSS